ncbi:7-cyano-7-deazaguanine synthase QueC [Saccharomonospora sp. CUA-673]|uniref:7-cyano-7-deazaguanine synthase QueC n=1 Tax=Pseudonocardiaceae TaxID=2070 RepID=UPI00058CC0A8|nr:MULTISPECIES: 7-cyano-7-deazaguanine synthase QueC [Pseudonocardiaceae]OLT39775.1 7-cyano-7-deazaguanine synthase QueC [Saccharomonospora sp. CUA-673]
MTIGTPAHRHPRHAIVIASGGLDSTVLAYWLAARGAELTLLSFDYGQRHRVELEYAAEIARLLNCPHETVELSMLGRLLVGSALTDTDVAVPDGYYTDESMRATVVPNRNAIMLDIAVSVAVARKADVVAFGAHAGDHAVYPDCRPEFVERFTRSVRTANEGLLVDDFEILAPFLTQSKTDIVRIGTALDVPFERTWSCYRGEATHCGTCGTCTERKEAFQQNGITDPTSYRCA